MDEALNKLGKQLRLQRTMRGLTQSQVADILGNRRKVLRLSGEFTEDIEAIQAGESLPGLPDHAKRPDRSVRHGGSNGVEEKA